MTQTPGRSASTVRTLADGLRVLLLATILIGFLRVTWQLDSKDLWWDESLSLQRAESDWMPLLQGHLVMDDGFAQLLTIDQHPFFSFALQGILIRLAGDSEYVLRFVSVMASTLLVVTVWVFARYFVRKGIWLKTSPFWAALFAAIHPFFLWYGQEARPYALWALLAILSTYVLVRATEPDNHSRTGWIIGYCLTVVMFLATHYYAVFLLPVHALLLYLWLNTRNRRLALLLAAITLTVGALIGGAAYYVLVIQKGGGSNFPNISWSMLIPDLVNAYSLGLSVDLADVWWLDVVFGLLYLSIALWGVRSWRTLRAGGWLPAALVIVPVCMLMLAETFQPAYMNARHLSLIGGGMILLAGGAIGLLWQWQPIAATLVALLLAAGMGMSSVNYFTMEEYAKDDFSRVGSYLEDKIVTGDLVLLKPTFSWRIFAYYLPLDAVDEAASNGAQIAHHALPFNNMSWAVRDAEMERLTNDYRRTWFVLSQTFPYLDPLGRIEGWLNENMFQVQETPFFSHSSLRASLYLPEIPVYETIPETIEHSVHSTFGDQITLVGYDVGAFYSPELGVPVTLYWQTTTPTDHHYKYALRLVEVTDVGERTLAVTEREPYDGAIPTIYWQPGQTIVEYSELPALAVPLPNVRQLPARYRLTLQVYRADTLEQLPVSQTGEATVAEDGITLVLPHAPENLIPPD